MLLEGKCAVIRGEGVIWAVLDMEAAFSPATLPLVTVLHFREEVVVVVVVVAALEEADAGFNMLHVQHPASTTIDTYIRPYELETS